MKKSLLTFLFFVAVFSLARAQGFRWQGVANDAAGNPVTQAVTLKFSILKNSTAVYVENQNPIAPVGGQISATVGGGTAVQGTFAGIDWANGPFSLKVEMKIGGAVGFLDMGTSLILPVPMALWAASSGNGGGGGWTLNGANIFRATGNVGIGTTNPLRHLQFGDGVEGFSFEKLSTPNAGILRFGDKTGWKFHFGRQKESVPSPLNQGINGSIMTLTDVGNVGIGTTTPSNRLVVEGGNLLLNSGGGVGNIMRPDNAGVAFQVSNGTNRSYGHLEIRNGLGNEINMYVGANGNVGIGTTNPTEKLEVNGRIKTKILEITGADIIEKANATEPLLPGEVVVWDISKHNTVRKSTKSYDPLGFGVVSGADGIPHGIELTAPGILDGNVNVAIAGRVKVKVTGKVAPGDLLTTSNVPGCAMKSKNRRKECGAILGKALSTPDENGLVLMLVQQQ